MFFCLILNLFIIAKLIKIEASLGDVSPVNCIPLLF